MQTVLYYPPWCWRCCCHVVRILQQPHGDRSSTEITGQCNTLSQVHWTIPNHPSSGARSAGWVDYLLGRMKLGTLNTYLYWQNQDKKTLKRINKLIEEIKRSPFEGIGKPEPLKMNLAGCWSRRIDDTNRLVYAVEDTRRRWWRLLIVFIHP